MCRRILPLAGFVFACTSCAVKPSRTYTRDFKLLLRAELSVRGLAVRDSSFSVYDGPSLHFTEWHVTFPGQEEQATQVFTWFKEACEQAIMSDGSSVVGRRKGNDQTRLAKFGFTYRSSGRQGRVFAYVIGTADKGTFAIFFVKHES